MSCGASVGIVDLVPVLVVGDGDEGLSSVEVVGGASGEGEGGAEG